MTKPACNSVSVSVHLGDEPARTYGGPCTTRHSDGEVNHHASVMLVDMGMAGLVSVTGDSPEKLEQVAAVFARAAAQLRDYIARQADELAPTHYCKRCLARWRLNGPDTISGARSWSLCLGERCGPCCDNVPMGEQIAPIAEVSDAT